MESDSPHPVPPSGGEPSRPSAPPAGRGPGAPPQASPSPALPPIIIQPARSPLSRLLFWLGWAGFALCGLLLLGQFLTLADYFDTSKGVTEQFLSGAKLAGDKVAVVTIKGVIMEGDGFVKRQIDRIRKDEKVKAVVVRINSPGGAVSAADYIYHHLKELRRQRNIPLIVSMGGIAASGGYYVAMAVGNQPDAIFAEPTTTTGSIGVIIPHYDLSGLLARLDVKNDSIVTHPRKEMLSMTKPMSQDSRELLERYIGEAFERFQDVVKEGRPYFAKHEAELKALATGEIFSARQAQKLKLIDRIGFQEDAIDRAIELAGLDKDHVRVVGFKRPMTLLGLLGFAQGPRPRPDAASLLELQTPRAYYLAAGPAGFDGVFLAP